ncbi:glycoside hydrolase [Choiromyces venosus 120613-1]|uniref:chitinase n=1 Tax=Choiromyces venosus 120613-1 TaxID=1336337 RepID=A0A3N4J3S3_9PEZI|nr:glycoside hydrolase [Choiromyces venosus 120613-1]
MKFRSMILRAGSLLLLASPLLAYAMPPLLGNSLFRRADPPNCGKDAGGKKCAGDLCCSSAGFCGKTKEHCDAAMGCQSNCKTITPPPPCDPSKAVLQRTVGYYQAYAALRPLPCNRVPPSALDTSKYTHLIFSFIYWEKKAGLYWFTPSTTKGEKQYEEKLWAEFTALRKDNPKLNTWASLGGGLFSNPPGPNGGGEHMKKWAEVTSDAVRPIFIKSLIRFMDFWKFNGVDLDWEFPGDPERGGTENDGTNFAKLVKELREEFKARKLDYGISIAIGVDANGVKMGDMAPHVDFFNWMSYDLHVSTDGPGPGKVALPHTNLTEIDTYLKNIWAPGLKSEQIMLGLADYGMSYTAPGCTGPGCPYTKMGRPSPPKGGQNCGEPGRMTNFEIFNLPQLGLKTGLDPGAQVKWTMWGGDQIVFWDDAATTMEAKKKWAKDHCLGGTMYWSVDQAIQTKKTYNTGTSQPAAGQPVQQTPPPPPPPATAVQQTSQPSPPVQSLQPPLQPLGPNGS